MVPKVGLEPTWVSPTVFETAASAYSATSAPKSAKLSSIKVYPSSD